MNVDKVSGSRAFSDDGDSFIEVDDPELIKIIYESHKKYPRKYLIEEKKILRCVELQARLLSRQIFTY